MKKTTLGIVALTAISLATIAQARPEPNKGTAVGAVVGGVAGGAASYKATGTPAGAIPGAIVGGAAGTTVNDAIDENNQDQ
ncbi:MAG: hypothetical protein N4A31_06180 [Rickettsiales bacterium]|nr:hypothetical protein [Rickettsiales bacterium]